MLGDGVEQDHGRRRGASRPAGAPEPAQMAVPVRMVARARYAARQLGEVPQVVQHRGREKENSGSGPRQGQELFQTARAEPSVARGRLADPAPRFNAWTGACRRPDRPTKRARERAPGRGAKKADPTGRFAGPRRRAEGFMVYRPESAPMSTPGDKHQSVGGVQKSKYDPVGKSARKRLDREGFRGPEATGDGRCPEAREGVRQTAGTGPVRQTRTARNYSRRPRPSHRHPRTGRAGQQPAAHRAG